MDELKPWIDDAIDLIEFATGDPAQSEWAALRAEMGHPEPFHLTYLEIGNEQGGDARYYERFGDHTVSVANRTVYLATGIKPAGGSLSVDDGIVD